MSSTQLARFATIHRVRFGQITTAEMLPLAAAPAGALSWKIGTTGPVGPDGYRLPGDVWCAFGLYRDREAASAAMEAREAFMPYLGEAVESWHAMLMPVMHRGECNHLDRSQPGLVLESSLQDPGGKCLVITTAGYVAGPDFRIERVIEFRRQVDVTNEWLGNANGCIASQVFTPHTVGDDGVTCSVWRDDASMLAAAYQGGLHRTQLDRHKTVPFMDRSSFTRFRMLETSGSWNGSDPATN